MKPLRMVAALSALLSCTLFVNCSQELRTQSEVAQWKIEHGLTTSKTVGPVRVTVSVLLAGEPAVPTAVDATVDVTHVLLTYSPADTASRVDVMFRNLESYQGYVERLFALALSGGDAVSIIADGRRFTSLGAEMMYDVGLSPHKRVIATIPVSKEFLASAQEATIVIRDQAFTKSVIALPIDGSALRSVPEIRL